MTIGSIVQSGDNPVDLISWELTASALKSSDSWWNGPQWLSNNTDKWLENDIRWEYKVPEELMQMFIAKVDEEKLEITQIGSNTSTRLTQITTYSLKFLTNSKNWHNYTKLQLIYPNLTQTEKHWEA